MNEQFKQDIINMRRALHQIPETGFKEFRTSELIKHYLTQFGYTYEAVAGTGIVAIKKGKSNESIAFRADMDGLLVEEKNDVAYVSTHEGRMHACGHDGHMAILLGFAKYLSAKSLNKNVVFIFQPAEEGPGGAETIIKEGILKKYNVVNIFGLHIYPEVDEGKIGLISGPMMAKSGALDLTIYAKSSHGAIPQNGIDGIYVASQLINAYQSIISRNLDPLDGAIITIGKMVAGETRNVLAKEVKLEGTIRTYTHEVYRTLIDRMKHINKGLEEMFGVKIEMDVTKDVYPPVINDEKLYQLMKEIIPSEEIYNLRPMMIAEDFSFYQEAVPGFFMMLGSRNEEIGYTHPLHSCYFNFNEEILLKGVSTYIKICDKLGVFE